MKRLYFKDKVVYQIYPKSFCDSNQDGIGDFHGIISKLDYLQFLGIDYIWLNACFDSPQKDNGYDVRDYYKMDADYGTMEDFQELCSEAKKRNIGIMLDMVFNHTSTQHSWFKQALTDKEYEDFYIFKDKPTNWQSKFGGSAWKYVPELNKYYLHLFDETQADLNWENSKVRHELIKIVKHWMQIGVEGFRFDVVNLIGKPEIFMDDECGDGRRMYTDQPIVHTYLQELNKQSFGQSDKTITVGEMSSTTLKQCVKYACEEGNELDMVFNFHHLKVDYKNNDKWQLKPFNFMQLKKLLHDWQVGMQTHHAWMALFWSNHDQPRVVSRFGNDQEYHKQSAKMLAACIHLMRGTPFIYQGEEIGMTNANLTEISQYRDVESLNYYEILKQQGLSEDEVLLRLSKRSRDNGRTVMQWNHSMYAGFSEVNPWIEANPNYHEINVEAQLHDQDSILHFYRKLIQLRKQYKLIQDGTFEMLYLEHPQILGYRRFDNLNEVTVLCNFYDSDIKLDYQFSDNESIILSNYVEANNTNKELRPYEVIVSIKTSV